MGRLAQAAVKERVQHERGIARPRVPVVVVALPTDPLRKGSRGRRDQRTRRGAEEPQREQAALHGVAPRTDVVVSPEPLAPGRPRSLDPVLDLVPLWTRHRLTVRGVDEREGAPVALLERRLAGYGAVGMECLPGLPRQDIELAREG